MSEITIKRQKISIISNIYLLLAIGITNFLGSSSNAGLAGGLIIFLLIFAILLFVNSISAFVFAFIQNLNLFNTFSNQWAKLATLLAMFFVLFLVAKNLHAIFRDRNLKSILLLAFAFSLYSVFNIGYHESFSSLVIVPKIGYIMGFWVIIPAYYFTLYKRKELFTSLMLVAFSFIVIYYLNLIFKLDLISIYESERGDTGVTRMMGYDIRQFIIFFFYLIPTLLLSRQLDKLTRIIGIFIGLLAYLVLVLAVYRLAMIYCVLGFLLSFFLIAKYTNGQLIFKKIFSIILFIAIITFSFSSYFGEIANVFSWTFDFFSGKANDASAAARFDTQLPLLISYFHTSMWLGLGLTKLIGEMNLSQMYGFVDFPILGTLAAYGIIGMSIYYAKFYFILRKSRIRITEKNILIVAQNKTLLYIYLTLKAYFITMITFRLFYISWELTFDYQQAEFGLFVGVFLAIQSILKK